MEQILAKFGLNGAMWRRLSRDASTLDLDQNSKQTNPAKLLGSEASTLIGVSVNSVRGTESYENVSSFHTED